MGAHYDVERLIIEDLLPNEYKLFIKNVIPVSSQRIRDLNQFSQTGDTRTIPIKSIREDLCVRIPLPLPVLLFIPESTHLLSRKMRYWELKNTQAGFLATYVPDLNHFTLLRVLTPDRLKQYFLNENYSINRDICERFLPQTKSVSEFSSLNFLLQKYATNAIRPSNYEAKLLNLCFEYAYWHMPVHNIHEEYDSFHNFIYHGYLKIHEICDIFKTLIKIENIDTSRHSMFFLKKEIQYRHVKVKILYGGTNYNHLETQIFIPEPLASNIQADDIINGIIANCHKFRTNTPKLILINTIGNIIRVPSKRDFKTIASISVHLYSKYTAPAKFIESVHVDDLFCKIENLLTFDIDFFGSTWNSLFNKNSVDISVTGLYPLLFNYNKIIYIIPPTLISYLSPHSKFLRPELLYNIINLINSVPLNSDLTYSALGRTNQSNLRKSDSYAALQHADQSNEICRSFFYDLPKLLNYISYSRVISRSIL